jgi:maleate isomerase
LFTESPRRLILGNSPRTSSAGIIVRGLSGRQKEPLISDQENRNRWKRDGWEATMRIGVLTPHADVGPESELQAMAPPGLGIHAARVPFGATAAGGVMDPTIPLAPVRAFAEPPHLDNAAELLAAAPLNAIAYGFTSSAYMIGVEGEAEMIARLEGRTRGIPVVAACRAAVKGLRVLAARRIALFDPPWFDTELNGLGRRYYESAGFEVVHSAPCGLPVRNPLVRIPSLTTSKWGSVTSARVSGVSSAVTTNTPSGFKTIGAKPMTASTGNGRLSCRT